MSVTGQLLQFPECGPAERRADAERAHCAISAVLSVCLACNKEIPHAPLSDGPVCGRVGARSRDRPHLNASPLCELMQIKNARLRCATKSNSIEIRLMVGRTRRNPMRFYFDISDRFAIRDEVGRDFKLTSEAVLHATYLA